MKLLVINQSGNGVIVTAQDVPAWCPLRRMIK